MVTFMLQIFNHNLKTFLNLDSKVTIFLIFNQVYWIFFLPLPSLNFLSERLLLKMQEGGKNVQGRQRKTSKINHFLRKGDCKFDVYNIVPCILRKRNTSYVQKHKEVSPRKYPILVSKVTSEEERRDKGELLLLLNN